MRKPVRAARAALAALLAASPALSDTLAPGSPSQNLEIDDGFVTGLAQPTSLSVLPDGRMIITQKAGILRVRTTAGTLVNAATFPVDSAGNERGLLNAVPHPQFAENRLLFVYYTAGSGFEPGNRLVTVELGANNQIDLGTQEIVLERLYADGSHNGGALALYQNTLFLGVGDATGPLRANCLTVGNGKILRINVNGSVPADNPLVGRDVTDCEGGTAPRTDIFTWGLRNPWRFWADPSTGNLWVADVGDGAYEEIDVVPKAGGVHLGWPHREADHPLPGQNAGVTACAGDNAGGGNCVEPVHTCPHPTCKAITGGLILDACEWPADLEGRYVFGDYDARSIWSLGVNTQRTNVTGDRVPLAQGEGAGPVHFTEHDGALYVVMFAGSGRVTRIAPQTPDATCTGSGGSGSGGASSGGASSGGASSGGASSGGANSGGSAGSESGGTNSAGSNTGGSTSSGGAGNEPEAGDSSSGEGPTGGTPSSAGRAGSGSGAVGNRPGTGEGGNGGDAGDDSPDAKDESGCGCRLRGGAENSLLAILAAALVAAFARRRRGRSQH